MAWYTTIYPEVSKFSWKEYQSREDLLKKIDNEEKKLNEKWQDIYMLCFASPNTIVPNDCNNTFEYIKNMFNKTWYEYISIYSQQYKLCRILELWDCVTSHEEYIKDNPDGGIYDLWNEDESKMTEEEKRKKIQEERAAWKPSLDWNHFEYSSDPEDGVKECGSQILKIKEELLGFAIAVPKDIVSEKDEEGNQNDISWYLTEQLRNIKEWLDDRLSNLEFSKLCIEYWDTHTLG